MNSNSSQSQWQPSSGQASQSQQYYVQPQPQRQPLYGKMQQQQLYEQSRSAPSSPLDRSPQPMMAAEPTGQQPGMYPPQPQPVMVNTIVQMNVQPKGPGLFVRALWYVFIGSWLGFFWLQVGYLLCLSVIGLPFGLMMLNRLPWVLTLRPSSQQVHIRVSGNTTTINIGGSQQYSLLVRALYFVFVGCWAGYLWASLGYALCLFIVTMPVGLMMLNRLPAVLTLRRN